jgi:multidrug efflux pump
MHFPKKEEQTDAFEKSGITGWYIHKLTLALDHPKRVIGGAIVLLIVVKSLHSLFGQGMEFFPDVESDEAKLYVHARGNLSVYEKDALTREVEERIFDMGELKSIYSRSGAQPRSAGVPEDVVGVITLEFQDWKERRKVVDIRRAIEERTKDISGIYVEFVNKKPGPPSSKPIIIECRSWNYDALQGEIKRIRQFMEGLKGLKAIEDSRSLPGIEWKITVDRAEALKFGADVTSVGTAIRLVTNGAKVGAYRPDDANDEVDILVRYPKNYRRLEALDLLNIQTSKGLVPISHFTKRKASPKISEIHRSEGMRMVEIKADIEADVLASDKLVEIRQWINDNPPQKDVTLVFRGEDEDQKETGDFLVKAFSLALFMIGVILVTQFNSFFSMGLVLSSVVMSTVGVFVGLLVQDLAFGVVMGGIGVIALAGIIVSNNIILIDTFDTLRKTLPDVPRYGDIRNIIIETCRQRLRPVILTKITTILGLLPIMFRISIDFINLEVSYGAPSTQWWVLLSSCIIYGVLFASSLTLFVTPCALLLRAKRHVKTGKALADEV